MPYSRPIEWSVVEALWGLERPPETRLHGIGYRPIDEARNRIVREALASDATHILFWDSDMRPPVGGLMRLLERGVSIVSGLAFGRAYPHWPVSLSGKAEGGRMQVDVNETYDYLRQYRRLWPTTKFTGALLPLDDALVERVAVGMAFTLIQRAVFEGLSEPWFTLNADGVAGEDARFCEQARKAGYRVWLDRSVVVGHGYGDQMIGPMDFLTYASYMRGQSPDEMERLAALGME